MSRKMLLLLLFLLVLPGLVLLTGCDDEGDTIIVDGLDCGLIRAELTGDWVVNYTDSVRALENCSDPGLNGTTITVTATPIVFPGVLVFGSGGSAGFQVVGDGPDPSFSTELVANVEADSCLALVNIWESAETAFLHCLGTFDRIDLSLFTFCDSAEIDPDPDDGTPGETCDLNGSILADIFIVPPVP